MHSQTPSWETGYVSFIRRDFSQFHLHSRAALYEKKIIIDCVLSTTNMKKENTQIKNCLILERWCHPLSNMLVRRARYETQQTVVIAVFFNLILR